MTVDLLIEPNLQIRSEWCEDLSAILNEALNNIIKHAFAETILIQAAHDDEKPFVLSIHDDGVGFDKTEIQPGGMGLQNMRERADRLGAKLDILSESGEGTSIQISISGKERD